MDVARLKVVIDGSAAGAIAALRLAHREAKRTASMMSTTLVAGTKAAAAGFKVLAAQAAALGAVNVVNALAPMVGLLGLLPGLAVAGAAALAVFKLGMVGVSDALSNLDDPKKFQEALDKLTGSAREFVLTVKEMQPQFRDLRQAVQEALFTDFGSMLKELSGAWLPHLREQLAGVAAEFNVLAHRVKDFLMEGQTLKDFDTILHDVRVAISRLRPAVEPFLGALRDLAVVSSGFLPMLASGLAHLAQTFGTFIAHARETGALKQWIQDALDAAKQFGQVLGNVGGILHSVFSAGNAAGGGLLNTLVQVTGKVDAFLKSTEGKAALTQFFTAAHDAVSALLPVITALLPSVAQAAQVLATFATAAGPGVAAALSALKPALASLLPVATTLGTGFGVLLGKVASILPTVAGLISDLASAAVPAILSVADVFVALVRAVAPVLSKLLPIVSTLIQRWAGALVPLIEQLAPVLLGLVPTVQAVANVLLNGFITVLKALVPVVAAVLPALAGIVMALLPVIPVLADLIATVVTALQPALLALAPVFVAIADVLVQLASALAPVIVQLVNELVPIIIALAPDLVQLVTSFGDLLLSIVPLLPPLVDFAGFILTSLVPVVHNLVDALSLVAWGWQQLFAVAKPVLDWLIGAVHYAIDHIGRILGDFAFYLVSQVEIWGKHLGDFVFALTQLPGQIKDVFTGSKDWLVDSGKALIDGFIEGIKSKINDLKGAIGGVLGSIARYFPHSPALEGPFSGSGYTTHSGAALMAGFAEGITAGLPTVRSTLAGGLDGLSTTLGGPEFATSGAFAGQMPFAPGAAGQLPASGNQAGTVINVNLPAGVSATDGDAIAAQVRTAVNEVLGGGVVTLRQMRGR